ncbi:MAG: hypothetical protein AAGN82_08755 [Myxococcota bacterium]
MAALGVAVAIVGGCGSARVNVSVGKQNQEEPSRWDQEGTELDGPNDLDGKAFARRVEEEKDDGTRPVATYPGFRMFADGSSRVFVEVHGRADVQEAEQDGLMKFRFQGVDVPERVNRLPLPTDHFETPVARVHVERQGADAVLVIALHYEVEGKPRLKRSDGGTVLSVDFPPYRLSEHHDKRLGARSR